MATLRRDGFASLEAEEGATSATPEATTAAAVAVTKPLIFTGRHLFVNFGVVRTDGGRNTNDSRSEHSGSAASLVVAVLDVATAKPIAPFHASTAVTTDSVRQLVTWAGGGSGQDLSAVAGKPVRMQFSLTGKGAQLFSFWVSETKCGESNGYVAAGGKGFKGMSDTNGSCV